MPVLNDAVFEAIEKNDEKFICHIINYLLDSNASEGSAGFLATQLNINAVNSRNESLLFLACKLGNLAIVKELLKIHSIDINQPHRITFETPLFIACAQGHTKIVEYLLKQSAIQINTANELEQTPLYIAAAHGHASIVLALLAKYAHTQHLTSEQKTALQIACENKHTTVIELLLQCGAGMGRTLPETILTLGIKLDRACLIGTTIIGIDDLTTQAGFETAITDSKDIASAYTINLNNTQFITNKIIAYLLRDYPENQRNNLYLKNKIFKDFVKQSLILCCQEVLEREKPNVIINYLLNKLKRADTLFQRCVQYIKQEPELLAQALGHSAISESLDWMVAALAENNSDQLYLAFNQQIELLTNTIATLKNYKKQLKNLAYCEINFIEQLSSIACTIGTILTGIGIVILGLLLFGLLTGLSFNPLILIIGSALLITGLAFLIPGCSFVSYRNNFLSKSYNKLSHIYQASLDIFKKFQVNLQVSLEKAEKEYRQTVSSQISPKTSIKEGKQEITQANVIAFEKNLSEENKLQPFNQSLDTIIRQTLDPNLTIGAAIIQIGDLIDLITELKDSYKKDLNRSNYDMPLISMTTKLSFFSEAKDSFLKLFDIDDTELSQPTKLVA